MASAPGSSLAAAARARAARLEKAGDLSGALEAYGQALAAAPDDPELLASLARIAQRVEMPQVAADLWGRLVALQPGRLEAIDGQARALREAGRFDDAVAVLRQALMANPGEARLWNALGVTLTQDSRAEEALTFLDEAVRLDPRSAVALYNRGGARFDLGRFEAAQADFTAARRAAGKPAEAAAIDFAAATLALARGDLAAGWEAYEARFAKAWPRAVVFDAPGRRWTPETPLAGRRLLVVAEQGLGDELMFANLLPDVLDALGPDGKLLLAVEPRLVELFRRSFPQATVSAHATRPGERPRRTAPGVQGQPDYWAPMGSLLRRFRRTLADFPDRVGYLRPDPARVAHWRAWLGEGPPAVGLTWRSGKLIGDRRRQYPPPEAWGPVLRIPGVRFVNIQYGDCAEDLQVLRGLGVEIAQPPQIDLRQDIDDLAALCAALGITVCVGNATAALAGACGAPGVLIGGPAAWPRLGSEGYPWYPQVQVLAPDTGWDWGPVIAQAAARVASLTG